MKLVYSTDKVAIVRQARDKGMSDVDILKSLTSGEYGDAARLRIVKEWAAPMGLTEKEAHDLAVKHGLLKR